MHVHAVTTIAGLGENDRVFERLETAHGEGYFESLLLKVDPVFDSLRDDSRFNDLLRRIGLEP